MVATNVDEGYVDKVYAKEGVYDQIEERTETESYRMNKMCVYSLVVLGGFYIVASFGAFAWMYKEIKEIERKEEAFKTPDNLHER